MATRWGIASAGKISTDFTNALRISTGNNHELVAVAARQLERAQSFAKEHGFKRAYGSYKELAEDKDVEIVYIGSIHIQHLGLGKMMMEAGKHVLIEKPMGMNVKETKELVALSKKHNVFLLEGVWSRFTPAYDDLRKTLDSGVLGRIGHTSSIFGVTNANVDRVAKPELGGGVTLDMTVYGIQFALLAFKGRKLEKITATGHLNEHGAELVTDVILNFEGGASASIFTSSMTKCLNEAFVFGKSGHYKMGEPFWTPTGSVNNGKEMEFPLPKTNLKFNYDNSANLYFEAQAVRECLLKGLKEHPYVPHAESIQIAEIMEEIRRQVGAIPK